jgi:hypothetical protein
MQSVKQWLCASVWSFIFMLLLSLAVTTGVVFLSFYIGWSIQYDAFMKANISLVDYSSLFAVPAVADPWPIFSCFLYGFLILCAVKIVVVALLGCCCLCSGTCCVALIQPNQTPLYRSNKYHYGSV